MSELPPLPDVPERTDTAVLTELNDEGLASLTSELSAVERATVAAMAPHQAQLRELRARAGEIATERRRRERAAHIAARAAVREQAKSGGMPSLVEALEGGDPLSGELPLTDLAVFLRSGGEVRLGYPARPGQLGFTDGRQTRTVSTWGEARRLFADGWEPGSPAVPGVRVHLLGTRVERVVDASEVVVRI